MSESRRPPHSASFIRDREYTPLKICTEYLVSASLSGEPKPEVRREKNERPARDPSVDVEYHDR
ncbi:hypothetical protein GQS_06060 [Thermococcus sp. 4557]|nr:hypothetical protein GQS_06060 [Thermococcus sp. 4557]